MKQQVLNEDTSVNPITTVVAIGALVDGTEDNMPSFYFTIKEKDSEIARLKLEFEQSRKQITTHFVNTLIFENFQVCAHLVEKSLHVVQSKFYSKLFIFMDFLLKFKTYVENGK